METESGQLVGRVEFDVLTAEADATPALSADAGPVTGSSDAGTPLAAPGGSTTADVATDAAP